MFIGFIASRLVSGSTNRIEKPGDFELEALAVDPFLKSLDLLIDDLAHLRPVLRARIQGSPEFGAAKDEHVLIGGL